MSFRQPGLVARSVDSVAAEGPNSSILRSARGTLEYRKLDSRLAVVAQTPQGTMTQQREVPERFAFIPHPPTANAWQIGTYHRARGGVHQVPL